MYKEFRELSRADAVKSLYQDMAARHRARFRSIHVRSFVGVSAIAHDVLSRFSVSSRSRRQTTCAVHTSSNFLCRNSDSPFRTGSASLLRLLSLVVPRHSKLQRISWRREGCAVEIRIKTNFHGPCIHSLPSYRRHDAYATCSPCV